MKKPPVGLEPRYIYESIRITQITDAIRRYLDADKDIPVEWIEEYNDLQSRQIHVIPLERVGETCPHEPQLYNGRFVQAVYNKDGVETVSWDETCPKCGAKSSDRFCQDCFIDKSKSKEPTAMMSAAGVEFDDPPPRPSRCYICGYYHLSDKPCPDGTK